MPALCRFAAVIATSLWSLGFAAPAHADGYAYGYIRSEISHLRLAHLNGTSFIASDFASVSHDYRATSQLASSLGHVLDQVAGPSASAVDLLQSCLGPTCPRREENAFEYWGHVPLVFSYADQQSTGAPLGSAAGYEFRQRVEAASLDGIGDPWGTWQSRVNSQLSIEFRPAFSEAMAISFTGISSSMRQLSLPPAAMDGSLTTLIEIVHVGSGTRWQLEPPALNRTLLAGDYGNEMREWYRLTTAPLTPNELYRLNITMTSDVSASTGLMAAPVPEPAGYVMYGVGLGALGWWRRRKAAATAARRFTSSP